MKLLSLEFYKCRRRKIVLVCAAVLAVELFWMGAFFTRQDAEDLQQGWMLLLYNLAHGGRHRPAPQRGHAGQPQL